MMDIRPDRIEQAKLRAACGVYDREDVTAYVADKIVEELTRPGRGGTGDVSPAGSDSNLVSPPPERSARSVSAPSDGANVAPPMMNFEASPVWTGHASELREECEEVEACRRREVETAEAWLWLLAGEVTLAVLIGGMILR